jgi:serine/threonine protein kinase
MSWDIELALDNFVPVEKLTAGVWKREGLGKNGTPAYLFRFGQRMKRTGTVGEFDVLPPHTLLFGRQIEEKPLGSGNFGVVYGLIKANDEDTTSLVCKVMTLTKEADPALFIKGCEEEIEIMNLLTRADIPHVVYLFKAEHSPRQYMLLMPRYEQDLHDWKRVAMNQYELNDDIANVGCLIPLHFLFDIMKQIFTALEAMHEMGVYHLDLKPANILVNGGNAFSEAPIEIAIGDFGLSKLNPEPDRPMSSKDIGGTLEYLAPELYSYLGYFNGKADVWSAGCILAGFINNRYLYNSGPPDTADYLFGTILDFHHGQLNRNHKDLEKRLQVEGLDEMYPFLLKLVKYKQAERYTSAQALSEWSRITKDK